MRMGRAALPTKPCARCGRVITWRKAWERDWESVRWCSDNCRKHGLTQVDLQLQDSLESLLESRADSASVDPTEAARAVGGDHPSGRVASGLHELLPVRAAGVAEITQGGQVIDPSHVKGPIRVRRPLPPGSM